MKSYLIFRNQLMPQSVTDTPPMTHDPVVPDHRLLGNKTSSLIWSMLGPHPHYLSLAEYEPVDHCRCLPATENCPQCPGCLPGASVKYAAVMGLVGSNTWPRTQVAYLPSPSFRFLGYKFNLMRLLGLAAPKC